MTDEIRTLHIPTLPVDEESERIVAEAVRSLPVELKRRTPEETLEYWQKAYVEQGAELRIVREQRDSYCAQFEATVKAADRRVAELEAETERLRCSRVTRAELDALQNTSRVLDETGATLRAIDQARIAELEAKLRRECSDEDLEALGITPDHGR